MHRSLKTYLSGSTTLLLALGLLAAGVSSSKAGEIFNFEFDNQGLPSVGDGIITPPLVGTGSLSFSNDVGAGIFALSDLGSYTISFTINGETFTDAGITTPLNEVAVNIFSYGLGQRLEFTENPAASPVDGGPQTGSLDFSNSDSDVLTFEPTYAGGNYEYQMQPVGGVSPDTGNYLATNSVPEPSTLTLLAAALVGFGVFRYRKRKAV